MVKAGASSEFSIPGAGGTTLPPPSPGGLSGYTTTTTPGSEAPLSPLPSGSSEGIDFASLLRTLKRRQALFLLAFGLVSTTLAINTIRTRLLSPVYQGGFQIQVRSPFDTNSNSNNRTGSLDEGTLGAIARSNFNADINSLTVLLRSPLLIGPLAEKQGIGMKSLIDKLSISPASAGGPNRNTTTDSVLNVSLRWDNPVKGQQILNDLAQVYTRFSQLQRQEAIDSGIRFLDKQAPEILARVDRLQGEMMRLRKRDNNLDPADNVKAILSTREGLLQQLRKLQTEQVQLSSQLASIESGRLQWLPSGAPTASEQLGRQGAATPGRGPGAEVAVGAKTPVDQLNELETDLATARATYREDSPIVQSLVARRNTIVPVVRRQAADEVRSQLLANVAQQDELNRQILLLNQNFRNNPQKMREYEDLQGRLNLAREHYTSYIQARENFRLELARSTTPWKVISPAEFGDIPVEPNLGRSLGYSLFMGLVAGLAVVVIREKIDNFIHTPMDAEKELQLPTLGLIPFLPLEPGLEITRSIAKMSSSERFAIKESLRSLFTTFRLLSTDRNIRMVGVTSSTQGEGKSTSVTIFARTLADLGLNVLVIDADMRLPMQSRYVGVEQGNGLSSLLTDPTLEVRNLIQKVSDSFDLLPAGPKPPDPARLLNSARCQEVVDQVRGLSGYDLVLWDTPPCLMLSDPILLGEKLDGILFLVGLGKVNRKLAPQACKRIQATGVDVLGMICNQVSYPTRLNDYGYEYGYYYHYAYAGAYSKSRYGSYGRGLRGYIKQYRDRYLRRDKNNPYGYGYGRDYIANRYLRDGDTYQAYLNSSEDGNTQNGDTSGSSDSTNSTRAAGSNSHHERRGPVRQAARWLMRRVSMPRGSSRQPFNSYGPYGPYGPYGRRDQDRDSGSANGSRDDKN